jgi:hypothetical protein
MSPEISEPVYCPTCGQSVRIFTTGEGTSYYVAHAESALSEVEFLRSENRRLRDAITEGMNLPGAPFGVARLHFLSGLLGSPEAHGPDTDPHGPQGA